MITGSTALGVWHFLCKILDKGVFSVYGYNMRGILAQRERDKRKRRQSGMEQKIKVYCYNRCTTCKKALAWLDEKGIEYESIDIKADHPDEVTLRKYYDMSGLPLKRFWNTSGIPYREMGLAKKLPEMSEDEQLALLATDGMLVKRPLLIGEGFVLTGFKEEEWAAKLK